MMNFLALSLVLTTFITAAVFSPSPLADQNKNSKKNQENDRDVIVKDGHRRVVVEYDNDDKMHTRISISPQDLDADAGVDGRTTRDNLGGIKEKVEDVKEKVKEVTSDVGLRIDHVRSSPRELVCDAYGKCKHKIASAIGRTKEKVYEVEEDVKDKVEDAQEKVKEVTSDVGQQIDDHVRASPLELVCDAYGKCKHKIASAIGKTKEKVHEVEEEVKGAFEKVEEKSQGQEVKETVKEKAKDLTDIGKTLKGDIERNASRSMEMIKKIITRLSPGKMAGIVELLGVSTGLGTSIWVTFGSSYILARALPKQQFAIVQSKIYPVYFKAMAFSIGAVLFGHLLTSLRKSSAAVGGGRQEMIQTLNLLTSLIIELINLFILEPRATKTVFDRMKLEKEGGGRSNKKRRTPADQPSSRIIDSRIEPAAAEPTTATAATEEQQEEEEETTGEAETETETEMIRLSNKLKKLNRVSSILNIWTVMALMWHLVRLGHTLHCV